MRGRARAESRCRKNARIASRGTGDEQGIHETVTPGPRQLGDEVIGGSGVSDKVIKAAGKVF